ncbi:MAG TPA: hypothetical protein VKQ06_04475, partial [Gammaproteobacteria bacterium]|nr:hypothetical protein [Gammaproteobacteria bacterium]
QLCEQDAGPDKAQSLHISVKQGNWPRQLRRGFAHDSPHCHVDLVYKCFLSYPTSPEYSATFWNLRAGCMT